ncbi:MAG: hypothetical protein JW867_03125 [Candidatus Omnitrophica bacterium]|nr:hypothetical protein [Candidatus Omnitrophota bacterium]
MKESFLKKIILICLFFADTEFLSRSIGFREANAKIFWIFKNLNKLWEDAFGQEFFKPEYSEQKMIFNDRLDYFGIIWKWSISGKLTNVYLQQIYLEKANIELNQHLENYIKRNPMECLKLLLRVAKRSMKKFPKTIVKGLLDNFDLKQDLSYQKTFQEIKSYAKEKRFGTAVGFNWSYQLNYFKPIMQEFYKNNTPVIYICEASRTEFIEKDYFGLYKVKLPTLKEVFKDKALLIQYKDDLSRLRSRIWQSKVKPIYKSFIVNKLLSGHLKRYYKLRFFIDSYCRRLNTAFLFALSERFDFQRIMQINCQNKNIPTFTYEPSFNAADIIKQWFYFSEYVLFSNQRRAKIAEKEGFSAKRLFAVGSTLADCYVLDNQKHADSIKQAINVLILTKPKRKTASSNDPVIEAALQTLQSQQNNYHCLIKPHIGDTDQYLRFIEKYKDKVKVLNRSLALYDCVPDADLIVSCGMSGAILECLPSKKPILVVDTTKTSDKSLLYRQDLVKIIPLFGNLDDFKTYLRGFLDDFSDSRLKRNLDIPQSVIDDFFYSLDGKTAQRVSDFVLSKV